MAEQAQIIKKVMDFSLRPGPRFREQGKNSGEAFYPELKEWFADAGSSGKMLVVVLDGTDGYLSSFIDESFGRLVYEYGRDAVEKRLKVISEIEPEWLKLLNDKTFPAWELRRREGRKPRETQPVE